MCYVDLDFLILFLIAIATLLMPNLQYSAAKSSRITKRSLNVSPVKRLLKSPLSHVNRVSKPKSEKQLPKSNEQLVVSDYNVQLDYQLSKNDDVMDAVNYVLDNQWAESCTLHSRYFPVPYKREMKHDMEALVFLLKGLSQTVKAEIVKYRLTQLPTGLVTTSQLYSIYEHQGHTFVDRSVEIKIRQGRLRKFVITNASPVILRSVNKFQHGKVSYGFENMEIVAKADVYVDLVKKEIKNMEKELEVNASEAETIRKQTQLDSLTKYHHFVVSNPTALYINNDDKFTKDELSNLLSVGLVTLTSNHLNEIESHQYSISYPACGTFLKLINAGRVWLVKLLSKASYKESLEEQLFNKWESFNLNGDSKMNNFRKPFYGYDLNWVLADALGAGVIEVFNTPVGRGWRLTGKI